MDGLKPRLKATWMTGDYDRFSRYMQRGAEQFFARVGVQPGERMLDVGCGAGQVALIAARQGVRAEGCDIAANWLAQARARAEAEGLRVPFMEGDAEALPYPEGSFEAVVSLIGAMFAPRPELVAAELKRVCRSGGRIAMGNWTRDGFIGQMLTAIAKHVAPPGMPSPLLWGNEAVVRERFGDGVRVIGVMWRPYPFEYPFGPAQVVEFFRQNYGPMARAFASLEESAQELLREELVALWSRHNQAGRDRTMVESEYLEVVLRRE